MFDLALEVYRFGGITAKTHVKFDSSVWNVCRTGQLEKLESLVQSHRHLLDEPNPNDPHLRTPLHVATAHGHVAIVEFLVESGSKSLDVHNELGRTPLHDAALFGDEVMLDTLLALGSKSIDALDKLRHTPLVLAICYDRTSIIEKLICFERTLVNTLSIGGRLPVCVAAEKGCNNAIESLFRMGSRGLDIISFDFSPIRVASFNRHRETTCILLALNQHPDDIDLYPITGDFIRSCKKEVTEDYAGEVRYRVWFSRSLVSRLLFELQSFDYSRGVHRRIRDL
ncbi:MAG: ankyrin repeat domain-containing protein [Spirochaetes bacterium]|nr:MAG: ankyrin repeat domain-containing protein [Spirochaetota bacterium]